MSDTRFADMAGKWIRGSGVESDGLRKQLEKLLESAYRLGREDAAKVAANYGSCGAAEAILKGDKQL